MSQTLQLWRDRPDIFVSCALGAKPELWQKEALLSLCKHDRVAIRSGHGVGKSTMMAWTILWWLLTRFPAKIACTAPTSNQLSDILWMELAKWHRHLHPAVQNLLEIKSDRVVLKPAAQASFAVARTARREQPEAFQGFHSQHMLFIIDEASGVDDIIFEVGEGAMSTKGAKTLMVGNPTRTSGYFYDAFHKARNHWRTMKVSCLDSSQVDTKFTNRMKALYGEDSNIYRVRVLGEFPYGEDDIIIPLHIAEQAISKPVNRQENQHLACLWGLDVARFGSDRTALTKRWGNMILEEIKTWKNKDLMQISNLIYKEYEATNEREKPLYILVDSIGLGAGVVDRLHEMGLPVLGINVAEASSCSQYNRKRDELWFKARDWLFTNQVSLGCNEGLIAELAQVKYSFNTLGKYVVESKDELKKRGVRSPDLADSFCLTFAHDGVKEMSQQPKRREKYNKKQRGRSWMSV